MLSSLQNGKTFLVESKGTLSNTSIKTCVGTTAPKSGLNSSAVDCNDNQLVIRGYMYIISGLSRSIFTTKLVNGGMRSNHIYDRVITHCLILYQAFV